MYFIGVLLTSTHQCIIVNWNKKDMNYDVACFSAVPPWILTLSKHFLLQLELHVFEGFHTNFAHLEAEIVACFCFPQNTSSTDWKNKAKVSNGNWCFCPRTRTSSPVSGLFGVSDWNYPLFSSNYPDINSDLLKKVSPLPLACSVTYFSTQYFACKKFYFHLTRSPLSTCLL